MKPKSSNTICILRLYSNQDVSVYLGAAPIVECLQKFRPNVIITSRVTDASLFLVPMVYELGWNWDELQLLAQGSLAGHLLECGCQLTGGYYMHPGDKYRDISLQDLLDLSLPFVEVSFDGRVWVEKAENSGGILNPSTCAEQLLYEVGDIDNVQLIIQDCFFVSVVIRAYEEVANHFYNILHKCCNKVQAVSCDEAFLATDSGVEDIQAFVSVIRKEILDATGCSASAGVAGNMLMAHLTTRTAKPDGQCYIPAEKGHDT